MLSVYPVETRGLSKKRKKKAPMDRTFLISESKGQYTIFLLLSLGCAGVLYLKTMSQTVTEGDSGELITAAATLGIAHWPGYPLYVMIGHVFINLFSGADPAYVMNLMSVLFGIATVGFLYAIIYHFTRIPFLSLSCALLFGWGETFWSQAVIAEVYTLHIFLVALSLFLLTLWLERRSEWVVYTVPFLIGLSCTNHQLSILLVPVFIYVLFLFDSSEPFRRFTSKGFLFLFLLALTLCFMLPGLLIWILPALLLLALWVTLHQKSHDVKFWLKALGLFCAGLLLYLYLPIRASMGPTHNWGNPSDIGTFFSAVLGPTATQSSNGSVIDHLNYLFNPFPRYTQDIWPWAKGLWMFEFLSPVFFFFGVWGIVTGLKTGWRMAKAFLLFVLMNLIIIITIAHPTPVELFRVDPYYLQALFVFTVFIGVGIKEWLILIADVFKLRQYPTFGILLILILLMAPALLMYKNYGVVDRSHETRGYDFALNMVDSVDDPSGSILVVNKDDLFLLWYLDKVLEKPMPVHPLMPIPGMPDTDDFWLGWYNKELALEDAPRVLFALPEDGDEWLTPEESLSSFILINTANEKDIYFASYGIWDVNVDLTVLPFNIGPYKSVYKVMDPEDLSRLDEIVEESLEFWHEILKNQAGQLTGYMDSPGRRPGNEFIIRRYRDNLFAHALQASETGRKDAAVEFCTMGLQIDPYYVQGLDLMAHLLVQLGNEAKAEVYVLDLLKKYPMYPEYHLAAADFYFTTGSYEKALAEIEITLELDPGNPKARELKKKIEAELE